MRKKLQANLDKLWSDPDLVSKYLSVYKLLDPSLPGLVLGSVFSAKTEGLAKSSLLELLVKLVITNKIKTQPHVLRSLQTLFKTITHEEFSFVSVGSVSHATMFERPCQVNAKFNKFIGPTQ